MTLGSLVINLIISLVVLIFMGAALAWFNDNYFKDERKLPMTITVIVAIVIIAGLWIGTVWFYNNTESGKRALKTQDSNFNNGIEREVIVYDMDGDIIQYYSGKFDIEYEDERILFDDENGLRHVIYFKTGTVIVNEIE